MTSLPGDQGFGLFAVLDYRDWLPGTEVPRTYSIRLDNANHRACAYTRTQADVQPVILAMFGSIIDARKKNSLGKRVPPPSTPNF